MHSTTRGANALPEQKEQNSTRIRTLGIFSLLCFIFPLILHNLPPATENHKICLTIIQFVKRVEPREIGRRTALPAASVFTTLLPSLS